jgi:hypothetical protein
MGERNQPLLLPRRGVEPLRLPRRRVERVGAVAALARPMHEQENVGRKLLLAGVQLCAGHVAPAMFRFVVIELVRTVLRPSVGIDDLKDEAPPKEAPRRSMKPEPERVTSANVYGNLSRELGGHSPPRALEGEHPAAFINGDRLLDRGALDGKRKCHGSVDRARAVELPEPAHVAVVEAVSRRCEHLLGDGGISRMAERSLEHGPLQRSKCLPVGVGVRLDRRHRRARQARGENLMLRSRKRGSKRTSRTS